MTLMQRIDTDFSFGFIRVNPWLKLPLCNSKIFVLLLPNESHIMRGRKAKPKTSFT